MGPWIDGQEIIGHGRPLPVISPSTARTIATVSTPDSDEMNDACARAFEAHDDRRWRRLPVLERQRILMAVAAQLRQDDKGWAHRIAQEMGMPEGAARFIEVPYAAQVFEYFAGTIPNIHGDTLPIDVPGAPPDYLVFTVKEPVGVAGLITPWNFPLLLPAWKLAQALAAGCTAVLKPAPESPLTALALGPLLKDAGVPDGVVNIVPGGDEIGAALVVHPKVAKIAVTGETETGRKVIQAAAYDIKRVSAELGGKSAMLIFEDCDMDQALSQSLFGAYFNAGQVCQATSRLLVQSSIYEPFIARLADRLASLRVGPATDPQYDLGPLIRKDHLQRLDQWVHQAVLEGARLITGGHSLNGPGFYYAPTVLADVRPDMAIAHTELFGPVATVTPFDTEDDAIRLANHSSYGLAAAVMTRDGSRALRIGRQVSVGTVWINTVQILTPTAPFGGVKHSGIGRELGLAGLEEYLETKTMIIDLNDQPMTYF